MSNGWAESAEAWIASMGRRGDHGREFILDEAMMERVRGRNFTTALDVGCGEGRFCRMLQACNLKTTGKPSQPGELPKWSPPAVDCRLRATCFVNNPG